MALKIYNTLTNSKEEFKPIKDNIVGLYTCGPTVYNYAHIGNLRTYIFEDILRRVLEYNGYRINHAMNITDVGHLVGDGDGGEDKLEIGAKRENKSPLEIAKFYEEKFFQDLKDLNILSPFSVAKATDTIKEQIEIIKILMDKGIAYQTSLAIYFDVTKFPEYGRLAGQKLSEKTTQAREEVYVDKGKKNRQDFALWFFLAGRYKNHILRWPSPWGEGFPGWHIECSAISRKLLGQPFDIHCGGVDHIGTHHTNEIAQSEAAFNVPLANYWLHGEFLVIDKKKMAKSEGTFVTLDNLKNKGFKPPQYRFLVLNTHYRRPLNFSWKAMETAKNGLEHLYNQVKKIGRIKGKINSGYKKKFLEKINDDLNIPQALAVVQDLLKSKLSNKDKLATILDFDKVLGLKLAEAIKEKEIPKEILELAEERLKMRQEKKWQEADKLRQKIKILGFEIEDTDEGYKIKKK